MGIPFRLPLVSVSLPTRNSIRKRAAGHADLWNGDEDIITQTIEAQDPVSKKAIVAVSSPEGFYTQLVRGDLSMLYLYWPLEGSHFCLAYNYTGFTPNDFSLSGLPYAGPTVFRGSAAQHFRYRQAEGAYITGAYVNSNSGAPLRLSSPSQQQIWDFVLFDNSTSPPAALFDVPPYCKCVICANCRSVKQLLA